MVNDDSIVWKALADPTRRAILDLLRIEPLPTGRISDNFNITRIAVMKHLNLLQKANLVIDFNNGREHWYRINALPMQEIYNRWMRNYEQFWAQSLLNLQKEVESMDEIKFFELSLNIQIKATPEKVFRAMTENISNWWGRPFITNKHTTALILEAKLGGMLYESWSETEGYKWGEVTQLIKNELLELTGPIGNDKSFYSRVSFKISKIEIGTDVEIYQKSYGLLDDNAQENYTKGWQDLIGNRLKKYVEQGLKLGLGNEPSREQ